MYPPTHLEDWNGSVTTGGSTALQDPYFIGTNDTGEAWVDPLVIAIGSPAHVQQITLHEQLTSGTTAASTTCVVTGVDTPSQ